MLFRFLPRDLPGRAATGTFILHSGIEKWNGPSAQAEGVHAMAAGAFPFLKSIPPERSLLLLAAASLRAGAPVYVALWFDTEDYIEPVADDAEIGRAHV